MELGHLLSGWMRVALVRWGLATAEVASIAVRANAVITSTRGNNESRRFPDIGDEAAAS
jgi:hypothetical protein